MSFMFVCPFCGMKYNVLDKFEGQTVACKTCSNLITFEKNSENTLIQQEIEKMSHNLNPGGYNHPAFDDEEDCKGKKGGGCVAGIFMALVILIALLVAKGGCGSGSGGGCSSGQPSEGDYKAFFQMQMRNRYPNPNCTWGYAFTRKDGNEFEGSCTVNGRTYAVSGNCSNGRIQIKWSEIPSY